jgi:hypothetical protein
VERIRNLIHFGIIAVMLQSHLTITGRAVTFNDGLSFPSGFNNGIRARIWTTLVNQAFPSLHDFAKFRDT